MNLLKTRLTTFVRMQMYNIFFFNIDDRYSISFRVFPLGMRLLSVPKDLHSLVVRNSVLRSQEPWYGNLKYFFSMKPHLHWIQNQNVWCKKLWIRLLRLRDEQPLPLHTAWVRYKKLRWSTSWNVDGLWKKGPMTI